MNREESPLPPMLRVLQHYFPVRTFLLVSVEALLRECGIALLEARPANPNPNPNP